MPSPTAGYSYPSPQAAPIPSSTQTIDEQGIWETLWVPLWAEQGSLCPHVLWMSIQVPGCHEGWTRAKAWGGLS